MLRRELYLWPFAKKLYHSWVSMMMSSNEISWKLPHPQWRAGCAPAEAIRTIEESCCAKSIHTVHISSDTHRNYHVIIPRESRTSETITSWAISSMQESQTWFYWKWLLTLGQQKTRKAVLIHSDRPLVLLWCQLLFHASCDLQHLSCRRRIRKVACPKKRFWRSKHLC